MATLVASELSEIMAHREPPCVSLYQPTYRAIPEKAQNIVRYQNLVKQLEKILHDRYGRREAERLIEPFRPLTEDHAFWNHTFDGVAVLGSPGFFKVVHTHRPLAERLVVADSFHVKPLLRILQSADRYHILGVTRTEARVFEGNRDTLDELPLGDGVPRTIREALPEEFTDPSLPPEVDPNSAKGFGGPVIHAAPRSRVDAADADVARFFRVVDRAMTDHLSRPSGLPTILAALPEHHATFRSVSENPFLLDETIGLDPKSLQADKLRGFAWRIFEPRYLGRLAMLCEEFDEGKAKNLADDDLERLAQAAVISRIRTLLVDADRHEPGRIDESSGAIERVDCSTGDGCDDLIDDLAELVIARGGEVVVVPSSRMPTRTGVAGIYRF
jgi:hypothetical protein